ncbi:hypothetical protein EHS25_000966 [Saitozyma podzolica]|uniref:Malate dehydrogenase n=1 Tax=Saitozyma podzolica TaxID=1890683 RepID=A0A427YXR0_9TREE|nr:hypothetical protein EHS25_000966 [Saitozyma podzolica]
MTVNGHVEKATVINVTHDSAHGLVIAVLLEYGVPRDRAELVAESLVGADLRGVDTHGINRLSGYIDRVEQGVLDPNAELAFTSKSRVVASLDARNTFGFVAASMAVDKGMKIAQTYGLAAVAVRNSNHYGMAATYLLRATRRGFAAMALTNASRSMPPWGAKEPLLGTSPFAVGVPGGDEALKGVVLPIGCPKGSGLALMMDIFGGVMSGANFAGGVNDQYKNLKDPQGVGHWFPIFKPDVFLNGGKEELRGRMDETLRKVRGCEKADGVERIYTSGEIEAEVEQRRRKEGIPLTAGEVDALHALADNAGVSVRLEGLP